jgi:hypothetical protein
LFSRLEARAKVWWDQGAKIVFAAEKAIADASNEIVSGIAKKARHDRGKSGEGSPGAAETPQNVQRGVGANEQAIVCCEDDDAVGQAGTAFGSDLRRESLSLKGREVEESAGRVVTHHELYGAMAQATVAVVEEHFHWSCQRLHPARE